MIFLALAKNNKWKGQFYWILYTLIINRNDSHWFRCFALKMWISKSGFIFWATLLVASYWHKWHFSNLSTAGHSSFSILSGRLAVSLSQLYASTFYLTEQNYLYENKPYLYDRVPVERAVAQTNHSTSRHSCRRRASNAVHFKDDLAVVGQRDSIAVRQCQRSTVV